MNAFLDGQFLKSFYDQFSVVFFFWGGGGGGGGVITKLYSYNYKSYP